MVAILSLPECVNAVVSAVCWLIDMSHSVYFVLCWYYDGLVQDYSKSTDKTLELL